MEDDGIELADLSFSATSASSYKSQLPWWVTQFSVNDSAIATFPLCSCKRKQEVVRYGKGGAGRTIPEAVSIIISKVRDMC